MIKIENTCVHGFDAAIRGMRNPLNSWDKSDSSYCEYQPDCVNCQLDGTEGCAEGAYCIGGNDLSLMKKLVKAGSDHSKFMRMINVTVDITAPQFWWYEFDTYKVGTVRNSCSKMHKLHAKEIDIADFTTEGIDDVGHFAKATFERLIVILEDLRLHYLESGDKKYWRALLEMLPSGYNMKATVQLNYQVLRNMYHSRKDHRLTEWHSFCRWIEALPYSELITM